MEYEPKTFFAEHDYEQVNGFVIIRAADGLYQIAEKWQKEDGKSRWISYQVPESDLMERVEQGHCEEKASVSDEQFAAVCDKSGIPTEKRPEVLA